MGSKTSGNRSGKPRTEVNTPAMSTKKHWGGPRPNSGGKRQGAGRKPQTIKISVEDARAILNYNMSGELIERLARFISKHEPKGETK